MGFTLTVGAGMSGLLTGVVTGVTLIVVVAVFTIATFVIAMLVITRKKKVQG